MKSKSYGPETTNGRLIVKTIINAKLIDLTEKSSSILHGNVAFTILALVSLGIRGRRQLSLGIKGIISKYLC